MDQHQEIQIEKHPLKPFIPENAKVVFLGSFPPQKKRWSCEFFYPNFINDHWRLTGEVFFGDKNHFVDLEHKTFHLDAIKTFLNEKGIGYYDTASVVRRLKDNASDKFLEVVTPTDVPVLVKDKHKLRLIVVTGEKACDTLVEALNIGTAPKVGEYVEIDSLSNTESHPNTVYLYRLPSSSRAYPLAFEKKAEAYRKMYEFAGLYKEIGNRKLENLGNLGNLENLAH